jgi:hypothetical protein
VPSSLPRVQEYDAKLDRSDGVPVPMCQCAKRRAHQRSCVMRCVVCYARRVTHGSLGGKLAWNLRGGRGWIFSAAQLNAKKKLPNIFEAMNDLRKDCKQQHDGLDICQEVVDSEHSSSVPSACGGSTSLNIGSHASPSLPASPSTASPSGSSNTETETSGHPASLDDTAACLAERSRSGPSWLHLTGTHVASAAGRLYTFRSALDGLPPSAVSCLDPSFVRALTSSSSPAHAPSVSTVLAATVPNEGLRFWRAKVGEEEANRVCSTAAARGTSMHSAIEKFLSKGGAGAGNKGLLEEGGDANDDAHVELLQSMSSIINSIAQSDSRLQP